MRDHLRAGISSDETPEDIMGYLSPDQREIFKEEWFKPCQRQQLF